MEHARMPRIHFRRIDIDADIHRIYAWLNHADVHRWYNEGEHSLQNYRQQFAPEATTHKFIILIDTNPVGYLQAYRLSDEPEYATQLALEHDAVSLDLFIGEADFRNSGWGSVVLQRALDLIVFGEMRADYACCNPDPENTRAIHAYQKAGFHGDRVVWIEDDAPENTGFERIMIISREEFYSCTS